MERFRCSLVFNNIEYNDVEPDLCKLDGRGATNSPPPAGNNGCATTAVLKIRLPNHLSTGEPITFKHQILNHDTSYTMLITSPLEL